MRIAIDGPAGAGKSTIARRVAAALGLVYIDTGAMYRALTYLVVKQGVDPSDGEAVANLQKKMKLQLLADDQGRGNRVLVGNEDITDRIREPEISQTVSLVSSHRQVRSEMVCLQQKMAAKGGVVMDGRDIGTTVMPQAEVKIFLKATVKERARRRGIELARRGHAIDVEKIEQEIRERDLFDSTREVSPLRRAKDAIEIDTTSSTVDQVVKEVLSLCKRRDVHV